MGSHNFNYPFFIDNSKMWVRIQEASGSTIGGLKYIFLKNKSEFTLGYQYRGYIIILTLF